MDQLNGDELSNDDRTVWNWKGKTIDPCTPILCKSTVKV